MYCSISFRETIRVLSLYLKGANLMYKQSCKFHWCTNFWFFIDLFGFCWWWADLIMRWDCYTLSPSFIRLCGFFKLIICTNLTKCLGDLPLVSQLEPWAASFWCVLFKFLIQNVELDGLKLHSVFNIKNYWIPKIWLSEISIYNFTLTKFYTVSSLSIWNLIAKLGNF